MTDRYERIRLALANGPTPGPWSVRYDYVVQAKSFDEGRLVPIAQPYGLRVDGIDLFANAHLIAACDPDTIRALLVEREAAEKERDALRTELKESWHRAAAAENTIKSLQAKIEAMERQEPVGEVVHNGESAGMYDILEQGTLLYSLPGAQPAPESCPCCGEAAHEALLSPQQTLPITEAV